MAFQASDPPGMMSPHPKAKVPILELTSLRFIAAAMLVLYHYNVFIPYPPIIREIMLRGIAGVCFFFILSGFVLTYNYSNVFHDNLSQYKRFAQARFARVFPTHAIALVLITPVTLYFLQQRPDIVSTLATEGIHAQEIGISWLANLLLVNVYVPITAFQALWNEPAWSINDEAFFYLLLPFFLRYVLGKISTFRHLGMLIIVLFLAQIAIFAFATAAFEAWGLTTRLDWMLGRSPFLRVWEFLIGCVLGAVFLQARDSADLPGLVRIFRDRSARNSLLLAALLLILGVIFLPLPEGRLGVILDGLKDFVLFTPIFAVIILVCAFGPTLLSRVLEHPWLVLLGEASYALYILHWIPVLIFERVIPNGKALPLWWYILAIGLTLLGSIGFHIYVELPLRRALRSPARRSAAG